MYEDIREEIETLLDGFEAAQTEDGSRQVMLPCGAVLNVLLPEDSPDLYAEAEVVALPLEGDAEARCRDLCSLNLLWRDLEGFTVAMRNGMLLVQTREDMARLADEDVVRAWLLRADKAVRIAREVALAPRDGAVPEDDVSPASDIPAEEANQTAVQEGVLWV